MSQQDYKNHIRWYPAHHFIFYPLVSILFFAGIYGYNKNLNINWLWLGISVIAVFLGWSSFMMRQHYALMCQNRIVRLEMRFRYFALSGKRLEMIEPRLSFGQIAALRFASDEELLTLIDKTLAEKLSPDEIKRSIRNWLADDMRV